MPPPRVSAGGRPLVITDPTLLVRHANERLVLLRERKVIAAVPVADVSHIAVHGPATFTGAALARILDAGIDVSFHSSAGRFRGVLQSTDPKNVYLLLAQVDAWNRPGRRLDFARPLVASKIAGQRSLLMRHARGSGGPKHADAIERLASLEERAHAEEDLEVLRGFEGAASAAYFDAFPEMLRTGFVFEKRVRRPPKDPVNALLSFGYTLAGSEVARHLARVGFDTRIGLLHGIRYGRESLPLDLVEELRAPMVDRFTLRLLNNRQLEREDFEERDDGAVRLRDDARRRYLELWEEMLSAKAPRLRNDDPGDDAGLVGARRVDRATRAAEPAGGAPEAPPRLDEPVTWRYRIERQAHRLRRFLLKGVPFRPLQSSRKINDPGSIDPQNGSARPPEPSQPLESIDDDGKE